MNLSRFKPKFASNWTSGNHINSQTIDYAIICFFFPIEIDPFISDLPDNTSVFELKRSKDAFLLEKDDQTLFTFPDGQILSKQDADKAFLVRGENKLSNLETVENYCIVDDNLGFGHIYNTNIADAMWKTLFFSYSKGSLSLCVD